MPAHYLRMDQRSMGVLLFIYLRHWRTLRTSSKFSTNQSSECLFWGVETLLTNLNLVYRTYKCVSVSLPRTMLHFGRKYDMRWLRWEQSPILYLSSRQLSENDLTNLSALSSMKSTRRGGGYLPFHCLKSFTWLMNTQSHRFFLHFICVYVSLILL